MKYTVTVKVTAAMFNPRSRAVVINRKPEPTSVPQEPTPVDYNDVAFADVAMPQFELSLRSQISQFNHNNNKEPPPKHPEPVGAHQFNRRTSCACEPTSKKGKHKMRHIKPTLTSVQTGSKDNAPTAKGQIHGSSG